MCQNLIFKQYCNENSNSHLLDMYEDKGKAVASSCLRNGDVHDVTNVVNADTLEIFNTRTQDPCLCKLKQIM